MSRRERSKADLQRRPTSREIKKRFLIVCEGESEPRYLTALKNHYRLSTVVVRAISARTPDPAAIVREAKERSISDLDNWDQVWCVFDIEAPANPRAAAEIEQLEKQRMGSAAKIQVAWSNPCFEVWILLHFPGSVKPFLRSADVEAAVLRQLPNYRKTKFATPNLMVAAKEAVVRAQALDRRHDGLEPGLANPNTRVGLLVGEILELAKG